ncbi:uncharacterized protein PITG_12929 [Phytophthora infestans T30-4]|uniref:Transmembrane protein, putative n=1 Tax=Phytophthora infestans (strain T30-4) TaxID=403677 RepID=D0NJW1_PHYIT|nr:uncharacterized protein PITG_12929 [Phytophthora infestans T30-4]EEY59798.1 transmembrane protein, putative [Phytophthora infestans T30-4]|eukprot:XP_002900483.1 transmembrane protein, putative [Phytophthora infestans T30-4]
MSAAWLHTAIVQHMINRIQNTRRHLRAAWVSVQVEFQGRYSVDRLQSLDSYSKSKKTPRLLAVLALMPLPSLAISLLTEVPPLSPPETATMSMAIVAGIAALTVFPLPFGLLAVGLPKAILKSA